jgi:RNA polymerase sigma-70 factor, ECF subfamily
MGGRMEATGEITVWLKRLREGDEEALERLIPLLYEELHEMARSHLRRERAGHTLNATALVNEVYLRLVRQNLIDAADRTHFFGIASTTMRRVLCEYARTRKRVKRGNGQLALPLEDVEQFFSEQEADEVLALDEALNRLAGFDPRGSEVVQYRFFSGLTLEETADALGVSLKTVQRDWMAARAWLRSEIARELL